MPFPTEMLGFVASESSTSRELDVTADYSIAVGATFMIASRKANQLSRQITSRHRSASIVIDTRQWTTPRATVDDPPGCAQALFGIDDWVASTLAATRATAALTPSDFIPLGDPATLREVVIATTAVDVPGLVPHLPTDAAHLEPAHLSAFLRALEPAGDRALAFTFAAAGRPLENRARLSGLRQLLSYRPGSWILEVDPVVGTDSLAHGAGWVGVGASSSRRWPHRPGDSSWAPRSAGGLPGLFLRDLLEFRSPDTYSDWYANSRPPFCQNCGSILNQFDATEAGRQSIVAHNVHSIRDFAGDLMNVPTSQRRAWLAQQREDALLRHRELTTDAASKADQTLRNLCQLDRPERRLPTRARPR